MFIRRNGYTIKVTDGTWGDRNDPYGYTDWDITRPDGQRVVYRDSVLGSSAQVYGLKGGKLADVEGTEEQVRHFVESYANILMSVLEGWYEERMEEQFEDPISCSA